MKKLAMLLGVLLALGLAAPAVAEVVDYGQGTKWDHTPLIPMHPIPGPADKEYHRASEPGTHIPEKAPPAAFAPSERGQAPAGPGHEFDPKMHQGL